MTSFQLQKEKEKEKAAREAVQKAAPDRSVTEESYGTLVDVRRPQHLPSSSSRLRVPTWGAIATAAAAASAAVLSLLLLPPSCCGLFQIS